MGVWGVGVWECGGMEEREKGGEEERGKGECVSACSI